MKEDSAQPQEKVLPRKLVVGKEIRTGVTLEGYDSPGMTITLDNWWRLSEILQGEELADVSDYIWRGQADVEWPLRSCLMRQFAKRNIHRDPNFDDHVKAHFEAFKRAVAGRRGLGAPEIPDNLRLDDPAGWRLWALGQHYGLDTPLLDWTESPYVALFFAFLTPSEDVKWSNPESAGPEIVAKAVTPYRGVFGLHRRLIEKARKPDLSIYQPVSQEQRLVSQGGLFTASLFADDLETWLQKSFKDAPKEESPGLFLKFRIRDWGRADCLRELARMNITHRSLFPDPQGSADYCNLKLRIPGY